MFEEYDIDTLASKNYNIYGIFLYLNKFVSMSSETGRMLYMLYKIYFSLSILNNNFVCKCKSYLP